MARYVVPAYIFSLAEVVSTVAPNNMIATWNPIDSGTVFVPSSLTINHKSASAGDVDPVRGYRISQQPTGGTLLYDPENPTDTVCRLDTAFAPSAAYIYTNNPTVGTLGAPFFNAADEIDRNTGNDHIIFGDVRNASLKVRPGEGLVFRQNTGKTGSVWNFTFTWGDEVGS